MTDYVIMPGSDYQKICDTVRAKTGNTATLKSGDLPSAIAGIQTGAVAQYPTLFYEQTITEPVTYVQIPWDASWNFDYVCISFDNVVLSATNWVYLEANTLTATDPYITQRSSLGFDVTTTFKFKDVTVPIASRDFGVNKADVEYLALLGYQNKTTFNSGTFRLYGGRWIE